MFKTLVATIRGTMFLIAALILGMSAMSGWGSFRVGEGLDGLSERSRLATGPTVELIRHIKDLQINVIQVQQWLTDISATRGLDGLNDGPAQAEAEAARFRENVIAARALALKMSLPDLAVRLDAISTDFPAYYAAGKAMAEAYVADGPAAGNPMMAGFDETAVRIHVELDDLLASLDAVLSGARTDTAALITDAEDDLTILRDLVFGLGGVALVVTCLVALFLIRRVVRPIILTTDITTRLSAGEDRVTIDLPGNLAEIRKLAAGLMVFRDNAEVQRAASTAVEQNMTPTVVIATDGRVILANPAFIRFWTGLGAVGNALSEGTGAPEARGYRNLLEALADVQRRGDGPAKRDGDKAVEVRRGDVFLEIRSSPILAHDKVVVAYALQLYDVSKLRKLESEFIAALEGVREGDFSRRVLTIDDRGFTSAIARGFNTLLDEVETFMADLTRATAALAAGDLASKMTKEVRGSLAAAQGSFNSAVNRLNQTLRDVADATVDVHGGAESIASGGRDLALRAAEQTAALERAVTTMVDLTRTLTDNASEAQKATSLSAEAANRAETGGRIVTEAVSAVSRIASSSHRIRDIVKVIDSIAFQTNLLALNAAVEAARAGDAGKGFAVVAAEVRQLAQRSGDAAREVRQLIDESTLHVADGVKLVNRTGETLEDLVTVVRTVAGTVAEISQRSESQSREVQQVSTTVQDMDDATRRNTALAEESALAAATLTEAADRLATLVSAFQLDAGETPRKWAA